MKVVINRCHGGFGLSRAAMQRYCEIKEIACWIKEDNAFKSFGLWTCWIVPPEERVNTNKALFKSLTIDERIAHNKLYNEQTMHYRAIPRNDPALVQVVEELGDEANGSFADLKVVEIPDDVEWHVEEYHGVEHIAENHHTWD